MNLDTKISDDNKLAKAREFKEQGNADYKAGKYKSAVGSYHRAILYLKGLSVNCPDIIAGLASVGGDTMHQNNGPKMSTEMEEEARTLTCDCYNNLAACMLKEPEPKYQRIIQHCDKALEASPHNVKALYRKGTALYALGDYEEALSELEKAPPDTSVKKYIDLCKAGIRKQDKEMAERYKGMFKS